MYFLNLLLFSNKDNVSCVFSEIVLNILKISRRSCLYHAYALTAERVFVILI